MMDTLIVPSGASEYLMAGALAWAAGKNGPGEQAIRALQANLGVPVTGVYDGATAAAVYEEQKRNQKVWGLPANGRADGAFFRLRRLVFSR